MNKELLKKIPKVDILLESDVCRRLVVDYGRNTVTAAVRHVIDSLRQEIMTGAAREIPERAALDGKITSTVKAARSFKLRPVINATGVVLHTNLGRAVLGEKAARAAYEAAREYSNLEYELETGARGSRHALIEPLLCRLTGCEAALAVNNNAAAVLLILSTMAASREVVISRGELVEIGGSFRVPEIMKMSGTVLAEVGTTNRTNLQDYKDAVTENTAALLKVHTSNFCMEGFVQDVPITELAVLGSALGLPVIYDMGSGALFRAEDYGLNPEPEVLAAVASKADVICFSGDKLLGGPQAGIILGKKTYIDAMRKNPLARALRLDKMTLAALQATLGSYLEPQDILNDIPTLAMLSATKDELVEKAQLLKEKLLRLPCLKAEVVMDKSAVGGGSLPGQTLPTACVTIGVSGLNADSLASALRRADKPVIGRISKDRLLLDMRTVRTEDIECVADALAGLIAGLGI